MDTVEPGHLYALFYLFIVIVIAVVTIFYWRIIVECTASNDKAFKRSYIPTTENYMSNRDTQDSIARQENNKLAQNECTYLNLN